MTRAVVLQGTEHYRNAGGRSVGFDFRFNLPGNLRRVTIHIYCNRVET